MNTTSLTKSLTTFIRTDLKICTTSAILVGLVFSPYTFANPTGGIIVGGDAHINHAGLTTNIHQHTDRLAIEWDTFNIENNEILNIDQPNQQSIILNRILDVNPSQINGQINANGQVIIANPNGVFFGENSSVNVGGLFAAALDVDPQEFMQGRINFKALENVQAVISNEGTLQVIDGGALVLLGQQIRNEGLLIANFGTVALAAGSDITVKFDDNSNLNIQINQNRLADILKLDDTQILNSGIIQAHGGNVVLTTTQASQIKTSIIKRDESRVFSFTTGTIVEKDGEIFLAGPGGDISNIGDVDVSENGDAGTVIFDANV